MKKATLIILHILGYPLLLALMLYLNWNIIVNQTKNYGIFALVGVLTTVVFALIYYVCYAAIASKKRKKRKSIFNQTVRLCMVVAITMAGLWIVADNALPDMLADATSGTVFYEDLADGWEDRAEVNDQLLRKFIEMNVRAGTLPYDGEKLTESEAIEYYQSKGYSKTLTELSNNEHIKKLAEDGRGYASIGDLVAMQFQSIDAKGYSSFTHPWVNLATSDRLTIPCMIHLLFDKREIAQDKIKPANRRFAECVETDEGIEVTSVFFAVCDKKTNTIAAKDVDWTILDMLGSDMSFPIDDVTELLPPSFSIVGGMISSNDLGKMILNKVLAKVASILADKDILGGDINAVVETGPMVKENSVKITLRPTTALVENDEYLRTKDCVVMRGALGYQEMAWLDSNGLLYAVVTLFSARRAFLAFAGWGVLINLLIGVARGMIGEEKAREKKLRALGSRARRGGDEPYLGIMYR